MEQVREKCKAMIVVGNVYRWGWEESEQARHRNGGETEMRLTSDLHCRKGKNKKIVRHFNSTTTDPPQSCAIVINTRIFKARIFLITIFSDNLFIT
jgi:hypothetical protein